MGREAGPGEDQAHPWPCWRRNVFSFCFDDAGTRTLVHCSALCVFFSFPSGGVLTLGHSRGECCLRDGPVLVLLACKAGHSGKQEGIVFSVKLPAVHWNGYCRQRSNRPVESGGLCVSAPRSDSPKLPFSRREDLRQSFASDSALMARAPG